MYTYEFLVYYYTAMYFLKHMKKTIWKEEKVFFL